MQQRPLIVPATLHFSGLPQKSSINTQEAITGKTINLTLFFFVACIVFILPGISVYLHEFSSFVFPTPTLYRFSNGLSITSLCTDPPPPSPQDKSEKGPLLRFFLRGRGLYTGRRVIHHKTLAKLQNHVSNTSLLHCTTYFHLSSGCSMCNEKLRLVLDELYGFSNSYVPLSTAPRKLPSG